jgi:hypothetical protein
VQPAKGVRTRKATQMLRCLMRVEEEFVEIIAERCAA